MKILITGGAGFIGSNLATRCVLDGHEVTVLDNLSPQIHGERGLDESPLYLSIKDRVRFVLGDVCNEADWLEALPGQEVIVHLAAETGTGQSMYQIRRYVDVNIGGTALMLDMLTNQEHSVRKVIVASSRSIHGEGKYQHPETGEILYPGARLDSDMSRGVFDVICPRTRLPLRLLATDEDSRIHPSSVYGITKQNQEQMVMTVSQSLGIAGVAFRYQNVYGPGQSLSNPYTGILSIFSTRIKNGNPINIFEDGLESRDFVFIDDVVDATYQGILQDAANGQVFGVGAGVPTTVMAVAQILIARYGVDVPVNVTGNYRLGDIRHNFADVGKARRLLGFAPKYTFDQGIARFTEWVNRQAVPKDDLERSLAEMKAKGLFK